MKGKIVTEFLHDVVRKHNLDTYMRTNANTNSDWINYVDPWGNIEITQLAEDWLATRFEGGVTNDTDVWV